MVDSGTAGLKKIDVKCENWIGNLVWVINVWIEFLGSGDRLSLSKMGVKIFSQNSNLMWKLEKKNFLHFEYYYGADWPEKDNFWLLSAFRGNIRRAEV